MQISPNIQGHPSFFGKLCLSVIPVLYWFCMTLLGYDWLQPSWTQLIRLRRQMQPRIGKWHQYKQGEWQLQTCWIKLGVGEKQSHHIIAFQNQQRTLRDKSLAGPFSPFALPATFGRPFWADKNRRVSIKESFSWRILSNLVLLPWDSGKVIPHLTRYGMIWPFPRSVRKQPPKQTMTHIPNCASNKRFRCPARFSPRTGKCPAGPHPDRVFRQQMNEI